MHIPKISNFNYILSMELKIWANLARIRTILIFFSSFNVFFNVKLTLVFQNEMFLGEYFKANFSMFSNLMQKSHVH